MRGRKSLEQLPGGLGTFAPLGSPRVTYGLTEESGREGSEMIVVYLNRLQPDGGPMRWVGGRARSAHVAVTVAFHGGTTEAPSDTVAAMLAATNDTRLVEVNRKGRELRPLVAEGDLLVLDQQDVRRGESTAVALIDESLQAGRPVCVVPVEWTGEGQGVFVGLEDDESSERALTFAAEEALRMGHTLILVHAWREPAMTLDGPMAILGSPTSWLQSHRDHLERARASLAQCFPGVRTRTTISRATPERTLVAASVDAAEVVLGSHAPTWGAVSREVMRLAGSPVLIVPPLPHSHSRMGHGSGVSDIRVSASRSARPS